MRELGAGRLPVLGRLAPDPARRATAGQPRRAWTSTTGSSTGCWTPASARSSRCTTGTCRRRCRTAAAGRPGDTADRFAEYAAVVAERLGDRVARLDHPERAAVLGLDRPPRGPDGPGLSGTSTPAVRAVAPPAARPRAGHAAIRAAAAAPAARIGIVLNLSPIEPGQPTGHDGRGGRRAGRRPHQPLVAGPVCTAAATRPTCSTCTGSSRPSATATSRRSPPRLDFLGAELLLPPAWSPTTRRGPGPYAPAGRRRRASAADRDGLGGRTPTGWRSCWSGCREYAAPAHLRHRERLRLSDDVDPDGEVDDKERTDYLEQHLAAVPPRSRAGRPRRRLLRLVAAGQLRVGLRLRQAVRPRPRRLRDAAARM